MAGQGPTRVFRGPPLPERMPCEGGLPLFVEKDRDKTEPDTRIKTRVQARNTVDLPPQGELELVVDQNWRVTDVHRFQTHEPSPFTIERYLIMRRRQPALELARGTLDLATSWPLLLLRLREREEREARRLRKLDREKTQRARQRGRAAIRREHRKRATGA